MIRRKHIIGLGLLAGTATALPAYAQPIALPTAQSMSNDFPVCTKKPTDGDQELAKQKFIAARQDYEEGNYDSAIKRFKSAYDLDCSKPELLLVISSSYEKKGDTASKQAALAALEVYTQRAPKDAPDMATTQLKIENMKKQMSTAPPPSASSNNPSTEEQGHTLAPWLVVGLGGVAVVTGIVFHVTNSYPSNCDPDVDDGQCTRDDTLEKGAGKAQETQLAADQDKAGNVRTFKTAGTILIGGGAALVVGGLVWHFLEPTGPKSSGKRRLLPTPEVAPGYAGISLGGRF